MLFELWKPSCYPPPIFFNFKKYLSAKKLLLTVFLFSFQISNSYAYLSCVGSGSGFGTQGESVEAVVETNCLGEILQGCTGRLAGFSFSGYGPATARVEARGYCEAMCPKDNVGGPGLVAWQFDVICNITDLRYYIDANEQISNDNRKGDDDTTTCNPINLITGNKFKIHTDVSSVIAGSTLQKPEFTRTYNSSLAENITFLSNKNWTHTYQRKIEFANSYNQGINYADKLSAPADINKNLQSTTYSSQQQACESGYADIQSKSLPSSSRLLNGNAVFIKQKCIIQDINGHYIAEIPIKSAASSDFIPSKSIHKYLTLYRPDGNVQTFIFENTAEPLATQEAYNATSPGSTTQIIKYMDNSLTDVAAYSDRILNYKYTDESGIIETYNSDGILQSITYPNGIIETLVYDVNGLLTQVDNNFGYSLAFTYNSNNYIETVTENTKTWTYSYTADNLLEKVINPDLSEKNYHYIDTPQGPLLAGLTDERSIRYSTFDYYDDGQAKSSYLGNSTDKIENVVVAYGTNGGTTNTLTNSKGNQTRLYIGTEKVKDVVTKIDSGICPLCSNADATFEYDTNFYNTFQSTFNLTKTTEFDITTLYNSYDDQNNPTSISEAVNTPEEKLTTYTYDAKYTDKITSITEPSVYTGSFKVTNLTYDAFANVTDITINGFTADGTPVTRSSTFTYDGPFHQISEYDGPRTDVSDLVYFDYYLNDASEANNRARLKAIRRFDGIYLQNNITYTTSGKIATEDRPNNLHIEYIYYADNERLKDKIETDILSGQTRTTSWTYLPTGEVSSITSGANSANAIVISFTYDDARRLTKITDALGNYINYTLDSEGNVTDENTYDNNNVLAKSLTRTFDVYNRLSVFTQVNENRRTQFNPDGTVDTITDGNNIVSKYAYDNLKRLTQLTENDNGINIATANTITRYTYDVQDNLTSVTDGNNSNTLYVYDDLGNLLSQSSPDTGLTEYTYDAAGNIKTLKTAKGAVIQYTYDELNRVTVINPPRKLSDSTYVYDTCINGTGELCEVSNLYSNVQYEYNAFGNVTRHQDIAYTYNATDQLNSITYPSGAIVSYDYDASGEVSRVQLTQNGITQDIASSISHVAFGGIDNLIFANGKTLNQAFDTAYRLTSKNVFGALELNYPQYDANGNIQTIENNLDANINNYAYDELNRLITADGIFGSLAFEYDKVGNRNKLTDTDVTDYFYARNSNKLTQIGTEIINSDLNGNMISDDSSFYAYNPKNQLTTIRNKSYLTVATYQYNGLDQRFKKQANGKTTAFKFGLSGELLVETTGLNTKEYIYLDGQLIAFNQVEITSSNAPAVVVSSDPVIKNGNINVDWAGVVTPTATDWVGIYIPGAADSDYLDWAYTDGTNGGNLNMPIVNASIVEGNQYEMRLYANDGFSLLATSRPFTITPTGTTIRNLTADALQGSTITVAWNGTTTTSATDWVGIYTPGAADTDYLAWVYTDGNSTGNKALPLTASTLTAGQTYEIRLYANDGYTRLATGESFVLLGGDSVNKTTQLYYIHNDHLGTPKALTDNAGQLVWKATASPFGKATVNNDVDGDGSVVEFNIRQPGQYYDAESGLFYNYFRYYDPETGRYVTSDPIGLAGGVNTYAYVSGNPLKYIDPYGLVENDSNATDSAGGSEHTAGARQSTQGKHEKGNARRHKDRGGEKGDEKRRPNAKRPKNWKGPWPPGIRALLCPACKLYFPDPDPNIHNQCI